MACSWARTLICLRKPLRPGSDVVRGAAVAMSEDSRHAYPSAPVLTREPSLTMHSPSTDLPALFVRPAISCTVDGSL